MWKYWINVVLGVLLILMPYLAFPLSWNNLFYVISGILIAVLSFWSLSEAKHKNDGA